MQSEIIDRLYHDTAVLNSTMLARIVEDVGADHVMLGTDHPFELGYFTLPGKPWPTGPGRRPQPGDPWDNAAALLGLHIPANG